MVMTMSEQMTEGRKNLRRCCPVVPSFPSLSHHLSYCLYQSLSAITETSIWSYFFFLFFYFLRFYLIMRERERERGTGRGISTVLGTRSRVSRITPQAEGGAKLLSHWGCSGPFLTLYCNYLPSHLYPTIPV